MQLAENTNSGQGCTSNSQANYIQQNVASIQRQFTPKRQIDAVVLPSMLEMPGDEVLGRERAGVFLDSGSFLLPKLNAMKCLGYGGGFLNDSQNLFGSRNGLSGDTNNSSFSAAAAGLGSNQPPPLRPFEDRFVVAPRLNPAAFHLPATSGVLPSIAPSPTAAHQGGSRASSASSSGASGSLPFFFKQNDAFNQAAASYANVYFPGGRSRSGPSMSSYPCRALPPDPADGPWSIYKGRESSSTAEKNETQFSLALPSAPHEAMEKNSSFDDPSDRRRRFSLKFDDDEDEGELSSNSASSTGSSGKREFVCGICQKTFSRNYDLKRHKRMHDGVKPFVCECCLRPFSRQDALQRHLRSDYCSPIRKLASFCCRILEELISRHTSAPLKYTRSPSTMAIEGGAAASGCFGADARHQAQAAAFPATLNGSSCSLGMSQAQSGGPQFSVAMLYHPEFLAATTFDY